MVMASTLERYTLDPKLSVPPSFSYSYTHPYTQRCVHKGIWDIQYLLWPKAGIKLPYHPWGWIKNYNTSMHRMLCNYSKE